MNLTQLGYKVGDFLSITTDINKLTRCKRRSIVNDRARFTTVAVLWRVLCNCCSIVEGRGLFTIVATCGQFWFVYICRSVMFFTTVAISWKVMDCLRLSQLVDGCGLFTFIVAMWILCTIVSALWKVMDCLQSSKLVDGSDLFTIEANCQRLWFVPIVTSLWMVVV